MQYYNGNEAYDFSRFEDHEDREEELPKLRVVEKKAKNRKQAVSLAVKTVSVAGIIVSILCMMLYNLAQLTELRAQISSATVELNTLESEYTRLKTEVDAKVSLRNIEEYAVQQLGLSKMEKQQIVYVDMCEGDKIELTEASPKLKLADKFKQWTNTLRAYINTI